MTFTGVAAMLLPKILLGPSRNTRLPERIAKKIATGSWRRTDEVRDSWFHKALLIAHSACSNLTLVAEETSALVLTVIRSDKV